MGKQCECATDAADLFDYRRRCRRCRRCRCLDRTLRVGEADEWEADDGAAGGDGAAGSCGAGPGSCGELLASVPASTGPSSDRRRSSIQPGRAGPGWTAATPTAAATVTQGVFYAY
jgi:hypothetical protein